MDAEVRGQGQDAESSMKLKRLVLKNYKQHKYREIEFEGNVIGVLGPNGSGKSNLLGSLHFAFAGEQPGFKKGDLLAWGADSGSVELEFEHNGVEGKITRDLVGAGATLKYGKEKYSSIKKVADAIEEHLGLDKDLLKQTVFVRQSEIDSILFEDPRIRELAFQKLCGIGEASKIHKLLGESLSTLSVPPNYDEQIAEGKKRHKEMFDRLTQLKGTAATAKSNKDKCPSAERLQGSLTAYESMRNTLARLGQVYLDMTVFKQKGMEAQTKLDALKVPNADIGAIDAKIDKMKQDLAGQVAFNERSKAWENAGNAIVALGDKPEPTAPPVTKEELAERKEAYDLTIGAIAAAESEIRMYAALAGTLNSADMVECPVCGGEMKDPEHVAKKLDILRQQLEEFKAGDELFRYEDAVTAMEQHKRAYDAKVQEYAANYAASLATFAQAEASMKAVEVIPADIAAMQTEIDKLVAERNLAVTSITEHSRLDSEVKSYAERMTTAMAEQETLAARADTMDDIKQILTTGTTTEAETHINNRTQELAKQIGEIQILDQQLAQLTGMINELSTSVEQLENTIGTLEHKRGQQGAWKSAIDTLTKVRDWFHYNNGPHTLASSVLGEMNEDVNNFLGQFTAPFSVLHSEGALGFKCLFHDGREMPVDGPPDAYHLSGGQKIQLAIAFRFASYCMFAAKLGILSLDEPTVYLDDANVGAFCSLLAKIKEVAKQMDLQVLVATHEPSVEPFMDTIISLYPERVAETVNT